MGPQTALHIQSNTISTSNSPILKFKLCLVTATYEEDKIY